MHFGLTVSEFEFRRDAAFQSLRDHEDLLRERGFLSGTRTIAVSPTPHQPTARGRSPARSTSGASAARGKRAATSADPPMAGGGESSKEQPPASSSGGASSAKATADASLVDAADGKAAAESVAPDGKAAAESVAPDAGAGANRPVTRETCCNRLLSFLKWLSTFLFGHVKTVVAILLGVLSYLTSFLSLLWQTGLPRVTANQTKDFLEALDTVWNATCEFRAKRLGVYNCSSACTIVFSV